MASTNVDEFLLNFDINQLPSQENVQNVEQKYEKLRKTMSWLKSKIITTDFAIQKYQAKKDDYDQSMKAHAVTKEELKQVCINFKDTSEKCASLENEKKILLANQEIFKERVIDLENKYSALISHTNQLQMLVKQLENEKDALRVEKELDNSKDRDQEIVALQKEKDEIFKDLVSLQDVILGKKKTCKRYIKLLKKYVKDVKVPRGSKILSTSEESDNDNDNYGDISSNIKRKLNLVPGDKEFISITQQNFNENYSDGEVSVDTGRGSSRANSHDKCLSSPDYVVTLETMRKIPTKDVINRIDAANSPITIYPSKSVATSPIIFDHPASLFEDHYDNYTDCLDGPEYITDDFPLTETIYVIQEQEPEFTDFSRPVPDLCKLADTQTSHIENEHSILKESIDKSAHKSLFSDSSGTNEFNCDSNIENEIPRCLCEKSSNFKIKDKQKCIDACTSPVPLLIDLRKFVDIGTNTVKQYKNRNSRSCEKSTCTDDVYKEFVNTCTSPIFKSHSTVNDIDRVNLNTFELPSNDKQALGCLNKNKSSKLKGNAMNQHPIEEIRTQEKICLESNSSKNLHFESINDAEIQNIFNVMKLHHDLISPISKTPSESNYLKLLPEMNYKLTKIWNTLANIYKMPNQSINNDPNYQNPVEVDEIDEIIELDTIDSRTNSEQQLDRVANEVVENDKIDTISKTNVETSNTSIDNGCSKLPCKLTNGNLNVMKSKETVSDDIVNSLLTNSRPDKIFVMAETDIITKEKKKLQQHGKAHFEFSEICKDGTNDTTAVTSNDEEKNDLPQHRSAYNKYTASQEACKNNIDNNTYTNDTETCTGTEVPIPHTIIINGTKTKKKSKLDKLRNKMLPICKIKKMIPPIIKNSCKPLIRPQDTAALASLNQKIAYDKAVKVMAEIRSNKELQNIKKSVKQALEDTINVNEPIQIESSSMETQTLSTRSRTRRLSKKDEDAVINLNLLQSESRNIQKSPINRKIRKRPADAEIDSLQTSCKRVLRSSNILPVTNEEGLPIALFNNDVKRIHNNLDNKNKYEGQVKNISYSDHSLIEHSKLMNDNDDHHFNLESHYQNCNLTTQKESGASAKSMQSVQCKKRMIPVIELSDCLADNANLVSIIPGKLGYIDVNKNFNHTKNSIVRIDNKIVGEHNNFKSNRIDMDENVEQTIEVTNTSQGETSKLLMKTKNSDSLTSFKEDCGVEHNVSKKIFTETYNSSVIQNENTNMYMNENQMSNEIEHIDQNNSRINVTQSSDALQNGVTNTKRKNFMVSYSDLDLFTMDSKVEHNTKNSPPRYIQNRKENILCAALDRYGVISIKYVAKKVPDTITNAICKKIEESIPKIIASSKAEQKNKMNDLVNSVQNYSIKCILAGMMKYLKDPTRKNELFNKVLNGAAPAMTKSEVILLYVIESLNGSSNCGFINRVLNNIEHALFQLNRAPEFDVIESLAHFYAVLCRYFRNKSRLRCFMLDAMYCLQFKAVPLIRQCLDVCPGVLPNAHERMAKTSLVTCLVYLLHFYKCQDRFNRAQDIRNILQRKYNYRFSEWNENMILEIFRKAIMDLRGTQNDKKMLRVALIILCKRHGAKWCQQNIIQNMLLPIIDKKDAPERIKQFCVLMLGPLLKPFPADRKAQCEIVINQLLQMLKQNPSQGIKEAIYSSLIFMNKHDQERVVQALLSWNPENVSTDFEEILNDYVMEKPLSVWKKLVTKKPSQCI